MGANDDREMLEVAKEECIRLELENAELLAMYQRLIEGRSAAWDAAIARAEDAERERDALAAENREALRRIENTLEVIGDPQHPRHRGETYSDLADRLLPILDPAYDTDEEIDADPIIRGVNRYETRTMAKLAAAQVERDALAAVVEQVEVEVMALGATWPLLTDRERTPFIEECLKDMRATLATAPAAALEAVKAEAWDEGRESRQCVCLRPEHHERNPYRKTNTKEAH